MPNVTLVIPVYNRYQFIDEAIKSFEMQEGDHELIIVDDGGSGNYTEAMKRHKIVRKENGGTPSAMNYGFKLAQGKYVTTIGDDDLLVSSRSLSARAEALDDSGCDFIYTNAYEIGENGAINMIYAKGECTKEKIWKSDCINLHTLLWRKSLFDSIGYLDEDLLFDEDWSWKIRLMHEANGYYIPIVSASTRYHSCNKTFGEGRAGVLRDHETMMKRLKIKYGVK